jgi:prepilin-type N-terminal cleavage/methylation domain-containing protein
MISIRQRQRAQSGFALLEVLVATAIAAISLAVIYSMFATSMRAERQEQATVEASIIARSLLAEVSGGARTEPGEYWSENGAQPRWRLRLTPVDTPDLPKGLHFTKVELAIWHLGQAHAPLEFATEVFTHDQAWAPQ